jgi:DNA modification methylase
MDVMDLPVESLIEYGFNNRVHGEQQVDRIANSIRDFGFNQPVVVDEDNVILVGHGRVAAAKKLGLDTVPVLRREGLTDAQKRAYRILDNKLQNDSEWHFENLQLELDRLIEDNYPLADWGLTDLAELMPEQEPQVVQDEFDQEAPEDTFLKLGDLIELGPHRLMCGDSTRRDDVEALFGQDLATMIHADPPYGMGKESEGVANDNLYQDKLDAFQMSWWNAWRPFVIENGSAYIWGTAPDLWRLWYGAGLGSCEPLTFRNEIVWDKEFGHGMDSDVHRMYPTATERALFFMLGVQGFNTNSDNYWEGWEPIRLYLLGEMERCGWSVKDLNRITGTAMGSHWVTKSQWTLITAEHYRKIQEAAKSHAAFEREHDTLKREHDTLKREHDTLKREFYSTRAHFDNTHDSMTDVWKFPRVMGKDRHGHATPKPIPLVARTIKSSSRKGDVVAVPFGGSGSDFIASEQLGRRCYGMEISPNYCEVIMRRYAEHIASAGRKPAIKVNGEEIDLALLESQE